MERGESVEYEPVSVKELLVEMKDTAELLIDLSYSAVLFDDESLATEVLDLEHRMDVLQRKAWMSLVMAGRRPAEAESLTPVFGVIAAAEKISDAAGDIAKVVLEDIGLPPALRSSLPEALEVLVRGEVVDSSPYAGRTLGEINLETDTGVRVIARRRDDEWLLNPGPETRVAAGDVLLCRGPDAGVETVFENVTGEPFETDGPAETDIADLDRAVETVVLMKNVSELGVDLAYGSVLFDSEPLANEVRELEVEVDALKSRFEAWALRAAGLARDPVSIRGLLHIAQSTEIISDAALEISEGVLRGAGGHPVIEAAVLDSDEIIVKQGLHPGSDLDGVTIADAAVEKTTGMYVVAVRRGQKSATGESEESADWDGSDSLGDDATRYVVSPSPDTRLHAGDVLVAKGTRTGADRLAELAE